MSVRVRRMRAHEPKVMSVRTRRRQCARARAPAPPVMRACGCTRCARVHAPPVMDASTYTAGDVRLPLWTIFLVAGQICSWKDPCGQNSGQGTLTRKKTWWSTNGEKEGEKGDSMFQFRHKFQVA